MRCRVQSAVNSTEALMRFIRSNDWQHDPLSQGSAANQIAARYDLIDTQVRRWRRGRAPRCLCGAVADAATARRPPARSADPTVQQTPRSPTPRCSAKARAWPCPAPRTISSPSSAGPRPRPRWLRRRTRDTRMRLALTGSPCVRAPLGVRRPRPRRPSGSRRVLRAWEAGVRPSPRRYHCRGAPSSAGAVNAPRPAICWSVAMHLGHAHTHKVFDLGMEKEERSNYSYCRIPSRPKKGRTFINCQARTQRAKAGMLPASRNGASINPHSWKVCLF